MIAALLAAGYCASAVAAAPPILHADALVARYREHCRPGDTIMLRADEAQAIAVLCDFSKSVVTLEGGWTACVMADAKGRD